MFDEQQLEGFRLQLLALSQELCALQNSGDDPTQTVELDQSRMGRLSRMDALQGQAMSVELKRRRELELKMIAAALHRIETHEYGCCVECGEDIALKRLELNPAAPLCIHCASQSEH
jgi:DnaK suppressor protein